MRHALGEEYLYGLQKDRRATIDGFIFNVFFPIKFITVSLLNIDVNK